MTFAMTLDLTGGLVTGIYAEIAASDMKFVSKQDISCDNAVKRMRNV
jgi:hypothetical protein